MFVHLTGFIFLPILLSQTFFQTEANALNAKATCVIVITVFSCTTKKYTLSVFSSILKTYI